MQVNRKQLEKLIDGGLPTAVLFGAPWCGTCTKLVPHLEGMPIVFYNVDDGGYEISTVPTLRIYKDGDVVKSVRSPKSKEHIELVLEANGIRV